MTVDHPGYYPDRLRTAGVGDSSLHLSCLLYPLRHMSVLEEATVSLVFQKYFRVC